MKTARIRWVEGLQFVGRAPSGHSVIMDGRQEAGGADSGVRPMELLLLGLGGCTGMDVISILQKMRVPFEDFEVEVHADSADEHPKIWSRIELVYRITGDVPEDKLLKAINLSQEKYCGASAMLGKAAEISIRHEIVKPQ